jgi:signal transduction histidine kinase
VTPPGIDEILEVLARASIGDLDARVDADPADLDDDLSLIANAVNVVLEDLRYRQRERERALEVAASARAKEEFLAQLSHDMQTPLAILLGYIDIIDPSQADPDDVDSVIVPMRHAAKALHRYVRQFLDYARLEADQGLVVNSQPIDVAETVGKVMPMFATEGLITLDVACDDPTAYAEEERVERILANLLSNAFSHAPSAEGVTIRLSDGDGTVDVTIIDTGPGMTREQLERAFEKFERGDSAEKVPGTGLGLYMSRALAEAQHGSLVGESVPGEGSRFTLRLPKHPPNT